MSRTTVRSREVLILLFVCRDHSTPPLVNMAWDRMVSVGRTLTIWEVLVRGANCTNVHLARLIAGLQKAGLNVHDKRKC